MWAVGCIFAELLTLKPLFQGVEVKATPNPFQVKCGFFFLLYFFFHTCKLETHERQFFFQSRNEVSIRLLTSRFRWLGGLVLKYALRNKRKFSKKRREQMRSNTVLLAAENDKRRKRYAKNKVQRELKKKDMSDRAVCAKRNKWKIQKRTKKRRRCVLKKVRSDYI